MGTHEDPTSPDEVILPDPGNSQPVAWTEPMTGDEMDEVTNRLNEECPPSEEEPLTANDFSALKED